MKIKLLTITILLFSKITFATTFHIDPANGNNISGDGTTSNPWQTLEFVIANNLIESQAYVTPFNANNPQTISKNSGAPIHAGDTLLLYSGLHGEIFIQNYINQHDITFKAAPDETPIIKKCHFQGAKNWILENITISSEPYNSYANGRLIHLESHDWQGPVSHITIKNNHIYSTNSPWTSAADWVNNVSDGIYVNGDTVLIENNIIDNIGFGITLEGDQNYAKGNIISNFSGDGMRVLGSENIVESNTIKNCYKVDDNHDDGIQSFTTGGLVADNNQIIKNIIINYEDPNQPLLGDLQGIGCFDGPYNNWTIENNLISVNHWHGISMYGAKNCQIVNNTVVDPTPTSTVGPSWILVENDGSHLATDCIVKNNISNTLSINPNSNTSIGNNLLLSTTADYSVNFVDYQNYDFSLLDQSAAIDNADNLYAPLTDIVGTDRPQGVSSDIGAYEYLQGLSTDNHFIQPLNIYPVPASNLIYTTKAFKDVSVIVYDFFGKRIDDFSIDGELNSIDISKYPVGIYSILIQSRNDNFIAKFVKF